MNWLQRPYPQIESPRLKLAVASAMGLVCFIFLMTFQPFGIDDIKGPHSLAVLGFGANCTIVLLLSYFAFPVLFPSWYNPEHWRVINEIVFFTVVIVLIGVLNYIHNTYILGSLSPHQHSLIKFIFLTLAVGVLPILMITYITEKAAATRNKQEAEQIEINSSELVADGGHELSKSYMLQSPSVKSESLLITIPELICVAADGNYINIYTKRECGEVEVSMMRWTLKGLLDTLGHHHQLIRCHKSYVVNRQHINAIEGNARSLYLRLAGVERDIPVSRSFDRDLLVG